MSDKKERMGMTTVLNVSGVDKQRFVEYTENNPATYKVSAETRLEVTNILISLHQDWSRTWDQETTGKEDSLRSPYLDTEFDKAREVCCTP